MAFKKIAVGNALAAVEWKKREHSDFTKLGLKHSLIRDFFSLKYRKATYERWKELPLIKTRSDGFVFSSNTPSTALREIFLEEIYNIKGFAPEAGQTVVDVGANYGDSAIWWSKKFGAKVVAFEPLPDVYSILQENIRLNNADVRAYNLALGDGTIVRGNRPVGGTMLLAGGDAEFKSARLDDFNLERADILKIDVEGFEYSVLKGSRETIKRLKPKIIIETHSRELRQKCHEFLTSMGYELQYEGRTTVARGIQGMDRVTNLFYSIIP